MGAGHRPFAVVVVDRDVERWMRQPVCAATERDRDGAASARAGVRTPRCVRPRAPMAGWQQNPHERVPMPHPRHLLRYLLLVVLAAATVLPAPAAAGCGTVVGTEKMRAAEARLLRDVNRIRVRHGRKPLRLDKRTSHVARARSSDMAAKRYFAHVEPDGDDAGRILKRRGIGASEVTENIGHTVGLTLLEGSRRMATWWYRSRPHPVQMLARDINYVGLGVARRGSRITYTICQQNGFAYHRARPDDHTRRKYAALNTRTSFNETAICDRRNDSCGFLDYLGEHLVVCAPRLGPQLGAGRESSAYPHLQRAGPFQDQFRERQ